MRIVLFVNDSYFSYLLARSVIKRFHHQVVAVVFSTRIKRSPSRILHLYHRTYRRYFFYRITVEFINWINSLRRQKSVISMAKNYNLHIVSTANVADCKELMRLLPADLGIAFNYDQILRDRLLGAFTHGVLNVHSSKLPRDRGISPVLWAYARGDASIWSTIYKMDEGIDSGPIFRQFQVSIEPGDTACSLYKRVCARSGRELALVVKGIMDGLEEPRPQPEDIEPCTWSWPDLEHQKMMVNSQRRFMSFLDIRKMLDSKV